MTRNDVDQFADVDPDVPMRISTSVSAARTAGADTSAAVRAAHGGIGAAGAAMVSSIGSHADAAGTFVAVYLTQHDVDLINLGLPVDLHAADHSGATLCVHVIRERRRVRRTPPVTKAS